MEQGEKISNPSRDVQEPVFQHGRGGRRENVLPGNKEFVAGDKISRPPPGGTGAGGSEASDQGEGQDDFVFQISQAEFLDFMFDDLALPNRSEEHTSELQSRGQLVCRLLLEKKN